MAIVGIIPARYQSSRFPGKPLADLLGRPVIQHVYERACRAALLEEVLVATDDQRVLDAVLKFGGEAIMTSPAHPTGADRVAEVARRLSAAQIIVNVQGDEPLIDPSAIDAVVRPLAEDESLVMSSVMSPITDNLRVWDSNIVKVVTDVEGFALYFSRAPIPNARDGVGDSTPWRRHYGLYAYRREFLLKISAMPPTPLEQVEKLEQLRALEYGFRIKMVELPDDNSIGVDTPEDLSRVRAILDDRLAANA